MVLASGGAARMEVRPGWRGGQDGGANRMEVWRGWRCGQDGGAARMEVRPGWRCGQDGGAARMEVPVAEAELDEACGEPVPEFPVTETVNLSADHDLAGGGDVLDRVLGCARDALRAYGRS